jgi:spermidine/putrescine transport system permease protein
MINADIVTGISLMLLFRFLHFNAGFITVLIAHITFNIPYVMQSVMPRMKTINPSVHEAALDLGAQPFFAFRKTVLPDLMPAVISGAMMAFTMSLDDFIITYFTKGSGFDTLSTKIYSEVKRGIQPEIYALSAIIFIIVIVLMVSSRQIKARNLATTKKEVSYASRKKLDKKTILILAGACAVIAIVGITFGGVFKTEDNQVYVYNWGEYIDPEVITMFEEETGIKVIYDEFESNEIMYAKIASDNSAYDVICPSDYMISRMIQEGMLKELDWEELPYASANIDPNYLESAASFDEGNRYAVPNFC